MRLLRLLLALLLFLPATPLADEAPPRVLVLVDRREAAPEVSAESFLLALLVHLGAADRDVQLAAWVPPGSLDEQETLARRRGKEAGAQAVVWYATRDPSGAPMVRVHVVTLADEKPARQTLEMGPPQEGIERTMAMGLSTLLGALGREALPPPSPTLPPAAARSGPEAGAGKPRASRPAQPAPPGPTRHRLNFLASYDIDLLPLGEEVRHGPTASLGIRLYQDLWLRLGAGYRTTPGGEDSRSSWSRDFLYLSASLDYWKRISRRWSLLAGGRGRVAQVFAYAEARDHQAEERSNLWELAVGLHSGAAVSIWQRLAGGLSLSVSWIPLGHELVVQGEEVAAPGSLEISFSAGLHVNLW